MYNLCVCLSPVTLFVSMPKNTAPLSILGSHRKPFELSDTEILTKLPTTDPVNKTMSAQEDQALDVGSVGLA